MAKTDRLVKVVLAVVVLLFVAQITHSILFYQYTQDQAQHLQAMQSTDRQLQDSLNALGTYVDAQDSQIGVDLAQTKTELGERIFDVETDLQVSQESLSSQLLDLAQSQAQTKATLESSIRNIQLSNQDFSGTIKDALPSVVSVLTDLGQGSGVIVTTDGLVITNYHVIEDASVIRVLTYDGELLPVDLIGFAQARDLAVLRIRGTDNFKRLKFSTNNFVGQNVVAIGNPGGLGFTVTEGIVSNNERVVNGQEFIQISAPINSGNSGGPLIDIDGDIVGINTLKITGFEGVGFAIPAADAKSILEQAQDVIDG